MITPRCLHIPAGQGSLARGRIAGLLMTLVGLMFLPGCTTPGNTRPKVWAWDFENEHPGRLATGWSEHSWGEGTCAWRVQPADTGQVFAQTAAANPNRHFNVAVYDLVDTRDGLFSVRFRAVSGTHDQGGGLVWRYRDADNHYIVRANPLENNVVLYKMENGVRTNLPLVGGAGTYGVQVPPMGNTWHTLTLRALGEEFTVWFDGRELFRVRDNTFDTTGRVGLWTKADAATQFDDLVVRTE